ncbi:MAG TPA: GNAT family protein [Microlunatus sp.]
MQTSLRLISPDDAGRLAELQSVDREILSRWEPERAPGYFTPTGQLELITNLLTQCDQGVCRPWVIESGGELIGRLTMRSIAGVPVHKATIGYWVASSYAGRGHASRAVAECLLIARRELRLHRIEASTQIANEASQRVLRRNGFTLMGVAHDHIFTAGRWHDELLWERQLGTAADESTGGADR